MSKIWQLSIRQPEAQAFQTAERLGFLESADALSVSVFEDGNQFRVEAIFAVEADAQTARALVGGIVEALAPHDWVRETQKGLPPIVAGRFIVHGSHDTPKASDDIWPILIDAGLAFGTGHHGTTQGCLICLDALDGQIKPKTILDVGTGAGVLAIAAAKLFPNAEIVASDNDPDAVMVTRENMALNDAVFETVLAEGFAGADLAGRKFDLILANILAGPLREMAGDLYAATEVSGIAILSGILDEQAGWVSARFEDVGFEIEAQPSLGGWTTLKAYKNG